MRVQISLHSLISSLIPRESHTESFFCCVPTGQVESELLHTYSSVVGTDILLLIVRLAVLMAVTLTVPVVIFPVGSHLLLHSYDEPGCGDLRRETAAGPHWGRFAGMSSGGVRAPDHRGAANRREGHQF